jgi:hypothetical protein
MMCGAIIGSEQFTGGNSAMIRRHPALVLVMLALVASACGDTGASTAPSDSPPESEAAVSQAASEPASEAPAPSEAPSDKPAASEEPAADELDWQLAPNFGSTELTAGFSPDPFDQILTSGGSIDASYLGDDCRGWATAAPDFDITYTAGGMSLLRFYFVADAAEDTTLIINAPDGQWYCNDDAPGTIDPMVDFTNPQEGLYDIWVGSFTEGELIEGTLYVTEISTNQP